MYLSFLFCQIYIICVVAVSFSYDKVSQFFFLQNSTGNYLLPEKEKHRRLSKEKQNT